MSLTTRAEVLVILAPGAEEIETVTIPDLLVRAGHRVTVASLSEIPLVTGSRGLPLAAHCLLGQVIGRPFDLIYLPGGLGAATACRDDLRVQDLAEAQLRAGRWLAVMCASPIALVPRALARGRQLTSHPSVRAQVEPHAAAWVDAPVVVDDNLVTSQGAGTALALGLALVRLLGTPEQARTIAASICAAPPS